MSRNYFDQIAEMYDHYRSEGYPEQLDEYLLSKARVVNNQVGIDFGTGAGHLAVKMARRFRQVKAIDIAPKMIECTKRRVERKNIHNVTLTLGNIDHLPYPAESIDLGYCVLVLHHIFDPGRSIKEMVRTIKPGGSLIIADLARHSEELLHRKMRDFWSGFDMKQFANWLEKAGLEEVWIETPKNFKFEYDKNGKKADLSLIIAGGKKRYNS